MFKKFKVHSLDFNIVFILFLALVVRLVLSFFGTLHLDQGTFIAWSVNLAGNGLKGFYSGWSDYLPGYLYVLWILGKIKGIIPDVLLYKLPAIISDLLTGYLIYLVARKIKGEKWGLIGSGLYLFNPAIFGNSAMWGQVDSITALFSLLSVYLVTISYPLSAIALSIGTLIKPQVAFIFPVVLFVMLRSKFKLKKYIAYGAIGLSVFVLAFLPFWQDGTFLSFIVQRLGISFNQYPYTSVNAFNFWGLMGFWKPDNIVYQVFGYLIVLIGFIILAKRLWKDKNAEYLLAAFMFISSFLFFTRMHERHLLPALAPLAVSLAVVPALIIPYVALSFAYLANLYYSYRWITYDFASSFPPLVIKAIIVTVIASLMFFIWSVISRKNININFNFLPKGKEVKFPAINLSRPKAKYILIGILAFAFLTRIFGLGTPPKEYFDEVYHAFTAKLVLQGDPKAWEWWNPNPEGFAYEWTHPPVAKLGMAAGMIVFGQNAFGWRIVQAILGTGVVLLVYLLAKEIFKDEFVGILSAGIFSLEGLALVMSRIGMNDTYMLFFMLATIYFFIRKKDLLSAVSLGLSLASKWSAVWVVPILFILWLKRKNKFNAGLFLSFLVFPFAVYLASYIPMFLTGHDLGTWWGVQQQMWWYHTGLRATHSYTSQWWSWPLLIRPIYLYTSDEIGGFVSRIYAMGNPIIFWFGAASVILGATYAYFERNKRLGLVIFSYLVFFVPWAASPRIMFLYHYLPSVPFLAIATGYILRRNIKLALPLFAVAFVVFIYFYPHWIGMKIPLWLDTSYYWIASWR